MSNPIITTNSVIEYLLTHFKCNEPFIQVIETFPNETDQVAYGVYVDSVRTISRDAFQMAIQKCGSIYTTTDSFDILFVSFQNDPQISFVEGVIQSLAQDIKFFDGYNAVTYSVNSELGSRAQKRTYTFNLTRTEFNSQL